MLPFVQAPIVRRKMSTSQHTCDTKRIAPRANFDPKVYLVTDRRIPPGTTVASIVRAAVTGDGQARATTVQLRDKDVSPESTYTLGKELQTICKNADATFIVNDSMQLALSLGADGVHLGQDDTPIAEARKLLGDKIIGISAGTVDEAIRAINDGADYIGVGAVYTTGSKADAGAPIGTDGLAEIVKAVNGRVPVVAIGGVNHENVSGCRDAGADGVAVISAIMQSDAPQEAAARLYTLFTNCN